MWIQIIKTRLRPGKDAEFAVLGDQLRALEQPGSGLIRSTATRDHNDPSTVYMIVTFESEEKARAREQDPRRQAGLEPVRELMAQMFEVDLLTGSLHLGSPNTLGSNGPRQRHVLGAGGVSARNTDRTVGGSGHAFRKYGCVRDHQPRRAVDEATRHAPWRRVRPDVV